jgi:hypothetical protein
MWIESTLGRGQHLLFRDPALTPRIGHKAMTYDLLIESYESERVRVLSVWSEVKDDHLPVRPRQTDSRGHPTGSSSRPVASSHRSWRRHPPSSTGLRAVSAGRRLRPQAARDPLRAWT